MNKYGKKTGWILIALFTFAVVFAASDQYGQTATERSTRQQNQQQQDQQRQYQDQQHQYQSQDQQQQQQRDRWSQDQAQASLRSTTGAGVLFSAQKLVGSDVKSRISDSAYQQSEHNQSTTTEQSGTTSGSYDSDTSQSSAYSRSNADAGQHDSTIGTVEELIINDKQDNVCYVVINSDGQHYPVPWKAFDVHDKNKASARLDSTTSDTVSTASDRTSQETGRATQETRSGLFNRSRSARQEPTLYLNLSKQQLRQAPTVSSVSIDRLSSSQLKQQIDSFYSRHIQSRTDARQSDTMDRLQQDQNRLARSDQQSDIGAQARTDSSQMNLLKASDVIGLDLQSSSDVDLGNIEDLVVDAREGHVAYGLVSFGGFLNVGEKTAAVPWSSLTIEMPQQVARIDATEEKLQAATVDSDNPLAQLSQPDNARRFHENFNAEPYWGVYGYVPGQSESGSWDAWKSGSSFNRKFDAGKVTTIEGTIENVSSFQPQSDATSGVALKVKTAQGETLTVYTGPQQYISQKGIQFTSGKQIEVTGSKVQIDGKTVILASQVSSGNQSLQLRDSQGNPQWNTQDSSQRQSEQSRTTGQSQKSNQDMTEQENQKSY